MILVGSSVWIDYFNGVRTPQTGWLDAALGQEVLAMGDIILTEVLQGFWRDTDYKRARRLLLRFPVFEMWGQEIALKSAEHYRFLRKKGITVRKTVDVVIATFCIRHDIPLLHDDRDFMPLEKYFNLRAVEI